MHPPGAAVFGWPLLWSLPMIPIRAVGVDPTPNIAFVVGLVLTFAALAVATIATAYVGLYATGRRSIGLGAAGIFALWPLVSGQFAGHSAWENGQWNVDVGLHLYTEPLSTALVVFSVALLLRPATQQLGRAGAGLAIGYATAVKLSNGVLGSGSRPARRLAPRRTERTSLRARGTRLAAPHRRLLAQGVRRHVRRRHLGLVAPVVALVRR